MTRRKFLKLFGNTSVDAARGKLPSKFFLGQRVMFGDVAAHVHHIYEAWSWDLPPLNEKLMANIHVYCVTFFENGEKVAAVACESELSAAAGLQI